MKDWWLNLSIREKQTVSIGGILVVIFICYAFIWSPINNATNQLREKIQHDHALLVWMRKVSQHIASLQKNATQAEPDTTSILGTTQNEINKSAFAQHVSQLRQADSNSVQFTLQKVDFDELITWLTSIWKFHNLGVTKLNLTPTDKPGIVSGDIVLQRP